MMKECAMKEGSGPISDPNVRLMLLTKGVEHHRRFPTDWLVRTVEDVSSQLFTPYMKSDLKSCAAAMMKRWDRRVASAARPGNTSVLTNDSCGSQTSSGSSSSPLDRSAAPPVLFGFV